MWIQHNSTKKRQCARGHHLHATNPKQHGLTSPFQPGGDAISSAELSWAASDSHLLRWPADDFAKSSCRDLQRGGFPWFPSVYHVYLHSSKKIRPGTEMALKIRTHLTYVIIHLTLQRLLLLLTVWSTKQESYHLDRLHDVALLDLAQEGSPFGNIAWSSTNINQHQPTSQPNSGKAVLQTALLNIQMYLLYYI